MKRILPVLVLLVAGCGGGSGTTTLPPAATSAAPRATATPASPTPNPLPSFTTPEAAMRYLAAAWNRHDAVSLKHVTDPNARGALDAMHGEAADLRLDHCTLNEGRGDYECYFTHGFPRGFVHKHPLGAAEFTVAPATRSGWYMTVLVGCGDGHD